MANCADCNKPTQQPNHVRCNACKQKRYRENKKKAGYSLARLECKHCKTLMGYEGDFQTTKKYCSQKCRQAAYLQREREAAIARAKLKADIKGLEWPMYLQHQRNEIELQKNEAGELEIKLNQKQMMIDYYQEVAQNQMIFILGLGGLSLLVIIILFFSLNPEITNMLLRVSHF